MREKHEDYSSANEMGSWGPRTIYRACKPNPVTLLRVTDANIGHCPYRPSPKQGLPSLPRVKGYVSSFKNLLTITFIYRLEGHWGPEDFADRSRMDERAIGPI